MIQIQQEDFNVQALYQTLLSDKVTGAVAMFVGLVRDFTDSETDARYFELEHYPGMTEHNVNTIVEQAKARWPLLKVCVVHRVGRLAINDQIVFVGVSASHRAEAFQACDFIMDYLKSRAAFWKKETQGEKSQWVCAQEKDQQSLKRWE